MGEFKLSHILIVGVVLLVFFGPSRLPGLGKSMGEAIRGFKKGLDTEPEEPKSREQITAHSTSAASDKQEVKTEKI